MSDVECPYCGKDQEINHDDGYGYEEGRTYEQQCADCEKYFAYTTSISFYYDATKADCLNGAEHRWNKPRMQWLDERKNQELWSRRCKDCDLQEQGYSPEWMIKKAQQLTPINTHPWMVNKERILCIKWTT